MRLGACDVEVHRMSEVIRARIIKLLIFKTSVVSQLIKWYDNQISLKIASFVLIPLWFCTSRTNLIAGCRFVASVFDFVLDLFKC